MLRHDFELAGLKVRPARNVIDDGSIEHALEPLVMDLLCVLAEQSGEVCSREDLLDQIWPHRHGADASLTRAISLLRKTLRDAGGGDNLVETVPKRGYRLTVEPLVLAGPVPAAAPTRRPAARLVVAAIVLTVVTLGAWLLLRADIQNTSTLDTADQRKSLAVLPMQIRNADPGTAFFADAIHDELLAELARFRSLKVISRTSVMQYRDTRQPLPEIAAALDVDHVVEGAVQQIGDSIRVNVQLIDASDDAQLWAQVYDREISAANLFAIQADIARSVAGALNARLTKSESMRLSHRPTEKIEAYQAYLLGRQDFSRRTVEGVAALDRALQHFNRALTIEADYAEALAGLASVHAIYSGYIIEERDDNAFDIARSYARRAIQLDEELAMPHAVLGMVESTALQRLKHARRAVELEPGNATAHTWLAIQNIMCGFLEVGERGLLAARQLDPTSAVVGQWLAVTADLLGSSERSLVYGEQGMAMGVRPAMGMVSTLRFRAGDVAGTRELFEKAIPPIEREDWIENVLPLRQQPQLYDAALRTITGPQEGVGMTHFRLLFFFAVDADDHALDLIERRLSQDKTAFALAWRRDKPELRQHPGFHRMAQQLGLPAYWRQHGFPPGCSAKADDDFSCG